MLATLSITGLAHASGPGEGSDIEIGGPRAGNGKLNFLRDLAFGPMNVLYALDGANNENPTRALTGNLLVQKFDAGTGRFLGQFSIRDEKLGNQDIPTRLAIDANGAAYVAVPSANLVQRFAADGKSLGNVAITDVSAVAIQHDAGTERVLAATAPRANNQWVPVDELRIISADKLASSLKLSRAVANCQDMKCDADGNIYLLGGVNQIFKFDRHGKLLKIVGGGTALQLKDGSELMDSVAVDSKGDIFSMTPGNPGSVAQFDRDVSTITLREGQFHWADAWASGSMLAVDGHDRIWVGVPGDRAGDEKYHYRPCIARLQSNFLDPAEAGVTVSNTKLLGLNLAAGVDLPYNVSTDLAPTPVNFKVMAGIRQISEMDVDWFAYDLFKKPVASGKFTLQLQDGVESRQTVSFTPPKFGWYFVSFSASSRGQPLLGAAVSVGFAPKYPGMIELPMGSTKGGWVDPVRQAFCGLPLIRVDCAQIKTPADADWILKDVQANNLTLLVQFQSKADCAPANVTQVVNLLKGRAKYYEIINEPNFTVDPVSYVNQFLKPTRELILSIDPAAKILGPDVCGIDLGWYGTFYKAGGKDLVDILSLHDYEGNEAIDPGHWRWKFGELRKIMARYDDAAKPIWQTERAIGAVRAGNFNPGVQAVRVLLQRDLLETLGVPAEHNLLYYMNSGGYSAVPTYVWSSSGPHPAALATRTRQAMIAARAYTGEIDFGPSGNQLFMGQRYVGADGTTLTLRNYGGLNIPLDLPITGAGSVDVVDAFGNAQSLPVENGYVHLITSTLPMYLRLAKGQHEEQVMIDLGKNLATQATFQYSAATESDFSILTDGIFEASQPSGPHARYWTGDLPGASQYLEMDFPEPKTIDRLQVFTVRAENPFCTLLDYDLQSFDGTQWKTFHQVRSLCPASDVVHSFECASTSWYLDQNLFVNTFSPITTSKLRLVVLRTTHGFMADDIAVKASAFVPNSPHLMLREIEIYGPSPAVALRVEGGPIIVKTAAAAREPVHVVVTNHTAAAIHGAITVRAPGWTVEPAQVSVDVAANASANVSVDLIPPSTGTPAGPNTVDLTMTSEGKTLDSDRVSLRYDAPAAIAFQIPNEINPSQQMFILHLKNVSEKTITGTAAMEFVGDGEMTPLTLQLPLPPLAGGASTDLQFQLIGVDLAARGYQVNCKASVEGMLIRQTVKLARTRTWQVLGPFPCPAGDGYDRDFGPEKTFDLNAVDLSAKFAAGDGPAIGWHALPTTVSGFLDLNHLKPNTPVCAYAAIQVYSPTARNVLMSAGSDDCMKAWINGDLVYGKNGVHAASPGSEKADIHLRAGWNQIIVKVPQTAYAWGLYFDLLTPTGQSMPDLKYSDTARPSESIRK